MRPPTLTRREETATLTGDVVRDLSPRERRNLFKELLDLPLDGLRTLNCQEARLDPYGFATVEALIDRMSRTNGRVVLVPPAAEVPRFKRMLVHFDVDVVGVSR